MAMFGYMTEIETVEPTSVEEVTASGDHFIIHHFIISLQAKQ